ncbi:hypothetical protein E1A91_A05G329800v1 [Gossypium mustelinum]|uniref:Uncharacterized protein n=1 Tax=Gossypium mustelinum TaxID=34275 RepID=A0A5D2ZFI5_GOSMU|nr:hypothetical protein E1A91_A05G329800v1 [Gossypium mustelinum]
MVTLCYCRKWGPVANIKGGWFCCSQLRMADPFTPRNIRESSSPTTQCNLHSCKVGFQLQGHVGVKQLDVSWNRGYPSRN